jgi:hypothetical protein
MPHGVKNWTAEEVVRFLKDRYFVHNRQSGISKAEWLKC